jgi:hypothetical protein
MAEDMNWPPGPERERFLQTGTRSMPPGFEIGSDGRFRPVDRPD